MRVNRLDLNQLACLDALLADRNVSRAADRLHLSQPAMSATLARMRDFFGDPLLVPHGRAMRLTSFAESLIAPVRDLLLQAQAITQRRPEANPANMDRDITMVCSDYVVHMFLAPLFRRAASEAPGLRFEVRSIAGYLAEELDQGDIDLVVSLASGFSTYHPSEVLSRDGFCCIAWSGNKEIGRKITREKYIECGHVVTVLGRGRVPTLDQLAVDEQKILRRNEIRVPAFNLIPPCIVGTNRIATVQSGFARQLAAQWDLKVFPCPIPIADIVIGVQWHRYQSHDPALSWVRTTLRDVARHASH
jgi:DNA-binding transcriptional LysR family regulator